MAKDASFDVFSRVDRQELKNAVDQTRRELETRFDFKGGKSRVELDERSLTLTVYGEADFKLEQVAEILKTRLAKRGVSLRALSFGPPEDAGGGLRRQVVTVAPGLSPEKAREIQRFIRESKMKVTVEIQGDQLRVSGKSKDDLQAVIALLKAHDFGVDLSFGNYR